MDSARWEKIQALFHEAAELPEEGRRSFLESQYKDDVALVSEVLVLLEEDAYGDSLLDREVAQVAHQVFSDSSPTSPPFKEFGPYRISRALGEGGMGIVYLADREDLGSQVAIKVLRDAELSPARRLRFAIEQRTLAQLNHPGIARLYDANTTPDGTPFFVMEYVEGVPLTEFCRKHHSSVPERLRLFQAVCEAVVYAHQQAVIHRDLKPSNILVKDDGSVRLLDFGIAKRLESLGQSIDQSIDQTIAGLRLMTPAYAAPEQIRGEQVGVQTDVYSLGVVLYELLAGRLPFNLSKLTPPQAEKVLTEQEAEKPSVAARKINVAAGENGHDVIASKAAWADLDVLCLTAIHKDIQQRYQSVEALLRDVDHFLKGEPLEARPDTARYRLRKFATRNWRSLTVAGGVFAVIAALVVFFGVRLANERLATLAEAARTQRIQKFMTSLFQGGDAAAGPADSLRVVTLLDRGVQEARSLNAEPEIQAELYQTLGTLYENLGKFDEADRLLNSALSERRSLFGPDHPQVAESLVALGLLRDEQAQLPEAERLVREGLAMTKRHLPPDHPAVARATTALGKVLADHGSYDAAISTLEEAVRLQSSKGRPTPESTASLYELASAHFAAGHYEISQSLNERLLPLYRQTYGERHPRVAETLMTLGEIQHDLGHYPEAEKFERQALEMIQAWYGKDSPEAATDLTIFARTLVFERRFDEATDLLQQSLTVKERVFGKVHSTVASSLNDLGNAASMQGKYDLAEQYFKREAEIYRAVYGEHHYLLATALSNLGSVYMGRQEWTRAEGIFRKVIPIYVETQSANNINTGIARIKLGRTLLRQNRYAEAEAQTRAGYDTLVTQMDPKVSWLASARKDLVEEYGALKQSDQAARFRAELTATEAKPLAVSAKK
jgi:serine/threonine-protein kinase